MAKSTDVVDGSLFRFMHRQAQRPVNRPVIDAVCSYTGNQTGSCVATQVTHVAMQAARDQLISSGHKAPSEDQVRARAYWGAALAAEEQPFVLAEDPRAAAKAIHYLASGAISSRVASWLPFLPQGIRHGIGRGVAHAVGVAKECVDQFKGGGFNRLDVATDDAGARAALVDS